MADDSGRVRRWVTALAVLLCLGPPVAVALVGFGVPAAVGAPIVAATVLGLFHRGVPPMPVTHARRHPIVATLWVALLLAASWQTARASLYANDVTQPRYSVVPGDPFRVEHCCLTAYAEAARFAADQRPVYDREAYRPGGQPRRIGPLTVDPYHYPPPFLFFPSAVRLVAPDFFDTRRVWFGLQVVVLGGSLLTLAWWVGGEEGRRVALLAAAAWAAPHTFLALQTGNFQTTAIALALLGCLLARSARTGSGAFLLALAALAKIFPGVLVLHVLAWVRWRLTALIAVSSLTIVLLAAAVFGVDTYVQFVRDELPRMLSGASFPQTEQPGSAPVNLSFYGLTVKLRGLGVTWLDQATGKALTRVYTLAIVGLALATGWALRQTRTPIDPRHRLRLAMLWLAILNFAALLSPFVGVAYGSVGTVWMAILLVAAAEAPRQRAYALLAFVLVTAPILVTSTFRPTVRPDTSVMVMALVGHMAAMAVNAWGGWAWWDARRPAHACANHLQPAS